MNLYVSILFSAFLIIIALMLIRVRGAMQLLVMLSIFSGLMACLHALLGAVDVAFTEAVVGASLSTLFLMALIRQIDPGQLKQGSKRQRLVAGMIALAVAGLLSVGVLAMPEFGDADTPPFNALEDRELIQPYEQMHTPNAVTAVLADYRSFDTLIEATVVLTAALACLLVLKKERHDRAL